MIKEFTVCIQKKRTNRSVMSQFQSISNNRPTKTDTELPLLKRRGICFERISPFDPTACRLASTPEVKKPLVFAGESVIEVPPSFGQDLKEHLLGENEYNRGRCVC
jgi:hypothetical protein